MADFIPEGISRDDILQAIKEFDIGSVAHDFQESIAYDIILDGKRYPPKAILGLAARRLAGKPLLPSDFKGGIGSKCFKIIERAGFQIVPKDKLPANQTQELKERVALPGDNKVKRLEKYHAYSRKDVHDIFAPNTSFTPQSGSWGISGIVPIPDRPGDFVFFVTFGQKQAEHAFEEEITQEGVLTWQSQPSQKLHDNQIKQFIAHGEHENSVYLFLRTRPKIDYTYLGKLAYLSHDAEREAPVHMKWQILDWDLPNEAAARMRLDLVPVAEEQSANFRNQPSGESSLTESNPPVKRDTGQVVGQKTRDFKSKRRADYAQKDKQNRELGIAGELLVLRYEKENLNKAGRPDLAEKVHHISVVEGDGAGYDIQSFLPDGKVKYIEVKTTAGGPETDFFVSANEVAFSEAHPASYWLYRVYEFDAKLNAGMFYVIQGELSKSFRLEATQFRVRR